MFAEFVVNESLALHICQTEKKEYEELPQLGYKVLEVAISGEGFDDHHGSKHTGGIILKYVSHNDTRDEFGRLLSFTLINEKLEAVVYYQFYTDTASVRTYAELKNILKENIGIEYISSFTMAGIAKGEELNSDMVLYVPHMSWCHEFNWKK